MASFEFSTRKFVCSHGRNPKGRGSWIFEVEGHELWSPSMTYTEAKKWALKKAKGLAGDAEGYFIIYVLP